MAKDPLPYRKAKQFVLDEAFIRQLCLIIKEHIEIRYDVKKTVLVTLAHDGIPPTHMIARELNLPMYVVNTPSDLESIKQKIPSGWNILVLDDIYDTGATYEKYSQHIDATQWIFLTAKQNVPEGTFCPCVFQTQAYIVYPWEKYDFGEEE